MSSFRGFGRGSGFPNRGGGRGGNNSKNNNNTTDNGIPPNIDWHASEPPKDYVYGKGRGDEGFTTGIDRPIDNPLDLLRNQKRAELLAAKKKVSDAAEIDNIERMIDAADDARREEERQARINALRHHNNQQQQSTTTITNKNNNVTNLEEDRILQSIPEVGKIMVEAPRERQERERLQAMENAEDNALLLPTNQPIILKSSVNIAKKGTASDVRNLFKGITAGAAEGSSDAIEEEGGVEFILLNDQQQQQEHDPAELKRFRQLTLNSIQRDPHQSEHHYLTLAQLDILESGGNVHAGYETILKGCEECGGHSSLLWLTAAKFSENIFGHVEKAKELALKGLNRLVEIVMMTMSNNNNNNLAKYIPSSPSAKSYPMLISFLKYTIQLFSSSNSNNENTNNINNKTFLLDILGKAVLLCPAHDPFWVQLFELEDPREHRKNLTIAMKAIRESKTMNTIPVSLWIKLAKLEQQQQQSTEDDENNNIQKRFERVKRVTQAGLKDHPNSPSLWLIQAVALSHLLNSSNNQDASSSKNNTSSIESCLQHAVDSIFHNNNNNSNNIFEVSTSWFSTCLDFLYCFEDHRHESISHQQQQAQDAIQNMLQSMDLMNKNNNSTTTSSLSPTISIVKLAVEFFIKKIIVLNHKQENKNNLTITTLASIFEALQVVTKTKSLENNNNNIDDEQDIDLLLSKSQTALHKYRRAKMFQTRKNLLNQNDREKDSAAENIFTSATYFSQLTLSWLVLENLVKLFLFDDDDGLVPVKKEEQNTNDDDDSAQNCRNNISSSIMIQVPFDILHHVLCFASIYNNKNNIRDIISIKILSLILKKQQQPKNNNNNTKLFLKCCSLMVVSHNNTFKENVLDKINNVTISQSSSLQLAKYIFSTNNIVTTITTTNAFDFHYLKFAQFNKIISNLSSTDTSLLLLKSTIKSLLDLEEEIKTFATIQQQNNNNNSPLEKVQTLFDRTQLLTTIRTTRWLLYEIDYTNNQQQQSSTTMLRTWDDLQRQDSFDNSSNIRIIDTSLDCRLILHNFLMLASSCQASSSLTIAKARIVFEEQIKMVERKLVQALDERTAMINQLSRHNNNNQNNNNNSNNNNNLENNLQACQLVIQKRLNTLCQLISVRMFLERDDPINKTKILDRFFEKASTTTTTTTSASAKTVWKKAALVAFASSSSNENNNDNKIIYDPLVFAASTTKAENTWLQKQFKKCFLDSCLFPISSSHHQQQQNISLLLVSPISSSNSNNNNYIPGLDLLFSMFIQLNNNNNKSGEALRECMKLVKEIYPAATTAVTPSPPFPLLFVTSSELYKNVQKFDRELQELGKAVDSATTNISSSLSFAFDSILCRSSSLSSCCAVSNFNFVSDLLSNKFQESFYTNLKEKGKVLDATTTSILVEEVFSP